MRLFASGLDGSDLFVDGFDNGGDTLPSGWSYEGTIVHTPGGKSLKLIVPASTNSGVNILTGIIASGTAGYRRVYLYLASLPTATRTIIGSTGAGGGLRLTSAGNLRYFSGGGVQLSTDVTTLTTGQWYCVEWLVSSSTANITRMRINGVDQGTSTTANLTSWSDRIGTWNESGGTPTFYYDDYAIDDVEWVGAGECLLALPISDNARAAKWTGGAGGTTNLYQGIDNTPPAGLVSASATNTSQIEHSGSGAGNEDYDANMTTYSTLGVSTLASRFGSFSISGVSRSINGQVCATSFAAPGSGIMRTIDLALQKQNSPTDNIIVELWSDDGGSGTAARPLAKISDLVTIPAATVANTVIRHSYLLTTTPTLTASTRYWIYCYRSGANDAVNLVNIFVDSSGRSGDNAVVGGPPPNSSLNTTFCLDFIYGDGDVVTGVHAIFVHGEDITTGTKTLQYQVKSNPAIPGSQFSAGLDVGAVNTYPTNWAVLRGNKTTRPPDIVVGNSPVMNARRPSTESRVASVCFMGLYVEWTTYTTPVSFGGEEEYYFFPQQIPTDEVTTVFA